MLFPLWQSKPPLTMQQPNKCHLLALPPEIRTMIWEYTVLSHEPITMSSWTTIVPVLADTIGMSRGEIMSIYFTRNTFRLSISEHDIWALEPWVKVWLEYFDREEEGASNIVAIETLGKNWDNFEHWARQTHTGYFPILFDGFRSVEEEDDIDSMLGFIRDLGTIFQSATREHVDEWLEDLYEEYKEYEENGEDEEDEGDE